MKSIKFNKSYEITRTRLPRTRLLATLLSIISYIRVDAFANINNSDFYSSIIYQLINVITLISELLIIMFSKI